MYEYYVTIMYDTPIYKRSVAGTCYKIDYKLDSSENMIKFMNALEDEGYKNGVVLFFKQLNEQRLVPVTKFQCQQIREIVFAGIFILTLSNFR